MVKIVDRSSCFGLEARSMDQGNNLEEKKRRMDVGKMEKGVRNPFYLLFIA
jgi:hypothetical protein